MRISDWSSDVCSSDLFGDTQVALASEMPGERAVELVGGRQVDIAVGDIDRRAAKHALTPEIGPLLGGQYLEGGGHSPSAPPPAGSASGTAISSARPSLSSFPASQPTTSLPPPSTTRPPPEP